MYVGFKRLTIQPLDKDFKPDGEPIIIEGKQDEGGMVTADISGLSKEPTKVSASNIAYYISRKGVGDVKVEFGILDLPLGAETRVLGREESENKVQYTGENTEAPYCSIMMESADGQGNTSLVGFFNGVFSKDAEKMETLKDGEAFEPEAETYSFAAAGSHQTDTAGKYMAKYNGADQAAITEVRQNVLLEAPKG